MNDMYVIVVAARPLYASQQEFDHLDRALHSGGNNHGFHIEFWEGDRPQVYVYAPVCGNWHMLPGQFLARLGMVIERNGLPYLEFGVAITSNKPTPNSQGGTRFRVYTDGSLQELQMYWPQHHAMAA
jgi:hypothetical protein